MTLPLLKEKEGVMIKYTTWVRNVLVGINTLLLFLHSPTLFGSETQGTVLLPAGCARLLETLASGHNSQPVPYQGRDLVKPTLNHGLVSVSALAQRQVQDMLSADLALAYGPGSLTTLRVPVVPGDLAPHVLGATQAPQRSGPGSLSYFELQVPSPFHASMDSVFRSRSEKHEELRQKLDKAISNLKETVIPEAARDMVVVLERAKLHALSNQFVEGMVHDLQNIVAQTAVRFCQIKVCQLELYETYLHLYLQAHIRGIREGMSQFEEYRNVMRMLLRALIGGSEAGPWLEDERRVFSRFQKEVLAPDAQDEFERSTDKVFGLQDALTKHRAGFVRALDLAQASDQILRNYENPDGRALDAPTSLRGEIWERVQAQIPAQMMALLALDEARMKDPALPSRSSPNPQTMLNWKNFEVERQRAAGVEYEQTLRYLKE